MSESRREDGAPRTGLHRRTCAKSLGLDLPELPVDADIEISSAYGHDDLRTPLRRAQAWLEDFLLRCGVSSGPAFEEARQWLEILHLDASLGARRMDSTEAQRYVDERTQAARSLAYDYVVCCNLAPGTRVRVNGSDGVIAPTHVSEAAPMVKVRFEKPTPREEFHHHHRVRTMEEEP